MFFLFCRHVGSHQPEACGPSFCEKLVEKIQRDNVARLRSPLIFIETSQAAQQEPSITKEGRRQRETGQHGGGGEKTGEVGRIMQK